MKAPMPATSCSSAVADPGRCRAYGKRQQQGNLGYHPTRHNPRQPLYCFFRSMTALAIRSAMFAAFLHNSSSPGPCYFLVPY